MDILHPSQATPTQRIDWDIPECVYTDHEGIMFPWYTDRFLELLKMQTDLHKWDVLEYGGGFSTIWWAMHAASVLTIESNAEWVAKLKRTLDHLKLEAEVEHVGEDKRTYSHAVEGAMFDCVVVDCAPIHWRPAVLNVAPFLVRPGGWLIVDNYDQPSVAWNWKKVREMIPDWDYEVLQHTKHRDWKTAYFIAPG